MGKILIYQGGPRGSPLMAPARPNEKGGWYTHSRPFHLCCRPPSASTAAIPVFSKAETAPRRKIQRRLDTLGSLDRGRRGKDSVFPARPAASAATSPEPAPHSRHIRETAAASAALRAGSRAGRPARTPPRTGSP